MTISGAHDAELHLSQGTLATTAAKCIPASLAILVAIIWFGYDVIASDFPKSLLFLNDFQIALATLALAAGLVINSALEGLLGPSSIREILVKGYRPHSHLGHIRIIASRISLAIAIACIVWFVLDFVAGLFNDMGRTASSVPKYVLLSLASLAIEIIYAGPQRTQKTLQDVTHNHGSVEFLTREQEVAARGDSVRDLDLNARMLLITTQKLKQGMVEGSNYVDEDFMKYWFREVSSRNLFLDQIILISGYQDFADLMTRVDKFSSVSNVRVGYILAPPSTIYADIFTVPGKHVLISFSHDASRRNLATHGLRLTGHHTVESFVRLHDQVFSREARWIKTFEGIDQDEVRHLTDRLERIKDELECTDTLRSLNLFDIVIPKEEP